MSSKTANSTATDSATNASLGSRFIQWIQEPMGSIIAASVASMGAFGVVLSGTFAIHIALG